MGVGAGGTVITVRDCTLADSAAKSIVMMQSSLFDDVYVYTVDCDAAARELTHISDLSRPLSVHAAYSAFLSRTLQYNVPGYRTEPLVQYSTEHTVSPQCADAQCRRRAPMKGLTPCSRSQRAIES